MWWVMGLRFHGCNASSLSYNCLPSGGLTWDICIVCWKCRRRRKWRLRLYRSHVLYRPSSIQFVVEQDITSTSPDVCSHSCQRHQRWHKLCSVSES